MVGKVQGQTGFTLIEVMVVVAILSLLASIALPSYNEYVKRGTIAEATTALSDGRVRLERYFDDNPAHVYTGFANCPASTDHFTITCTVAAGTYTVAATGKGTMSGFGYSINQANAKSTTSVPSGWSAPSPNNCWVLRKDGSC